MDSGVRMDKIRAIGEIPGLAPAALGAIALVAAIECLPSVAYGQTISITPAFASSTTGAMDFAPVTRWAAVLFTPSDFLWLLLALGLLLQLTRRKKLGWALVIGVTSFLVLMLIFPLDRWLAEPLENQFPRPSWPAHVDGIVVLGGGENGAVFSARGVQAPDPAEGRLIAGADLARRYPDAKLIFSGGSPALA